MISPPIHSQLVMSYVELWRRMLHGPLLNPRPLATRVRHVERRWWKPRWRVEAMEPGGLWVFMAWTRTRRGGERIRSVL